MSDVKFKDLVTDVEDALRVRFLKSSDVISRGEKIRRLEFTLSTEYKNIGDFSSIVSSILDKHRGGHSVILAKGKFILNIYNYEHTEEKGNN